MASVAENSNKPSILVVILTQNHSTNIRLLDFTVVNLCKQGSVGLQLVCSFNDRIIQHEHKWHLRFQLLRYMKMKSAILFEKLQSFSFILHVTTCRTLAKILGHFSKIVQLYEYCS